MKKNVLLYQLAIICRIILRYRIDELFDFLRETHSVMGHGRNRKINF